MAQAGPGRPGPPGVDQAASNLTEIFLLLPPKCWGNGMSSHHHMVESGLSTLAE